jgi:hypothetical protein|tara:strand:+ start:141 stop:1274 length:1134 start_codon:yes stop_codon:yes gene_type:complete
MLIQDNEIVDLSKVKRLSQDHLNTHLKYHNKEINPIMYGDKFPYGKASEPTLVDRKDIKWRGGRFQTYQTRFGNGNPRQKDISNSIHEQGLKLKSPGLSLIRKADGLYPLTGHTREGIFEGIGLENCIATIYEIPEESDASAFALELNPKQDPAGPMTLYDVEQHCKIALQKGWIDKHDDMMKQIEAISERFYRICKNSFTKNAMDAAILRVYNDMDSSADDVISWETQTQIKTWLSQNKYINTDKIKYLVVSASTVSSTITKAARLAKDNIGAEIRVVIHTGVLDSGNLLNSYNDLIDKFKTIWESDIENIRATFFEASPKESKVAFANNIVLYGALPALAKNHDLNKIRLFKKQQTVTVNGESEEIFQATSPLNI